MAEEKSISTDGNVDTAVVRDVCKTLFGVSEEAEMDKEAFYGPRFSFTLAFLPKDSTNASELAVLFLDLPLGRTLANKTEFDALVERLTATFSEKSGRQQRYVPQAEADKLVRQYQDQLQFEALVKSGYKFHEA